MNDENDRFLEATESVSNTHMARIVDLGIEFIRLDNEIKKMENLLEVRKKQFKAISEAELPDLMAKARMQEFTLLNGFKLKVEPFIAVKLPKDNADAADAWLLAHGHDGMMKHNLEVHLPRGVPADKVDALKKQIESAGFDCDDTKSIHYQTLAKWGREMEAEGEVIPEDIFEVYRGQKTKITG